MSDKPTYEELENRIKELEKAELERKWPKEGQRESEDKYREIANHVPGMVYQFVLHQDGSFSVPFISDQVREFAGYNPEEVMVTAIEGNQATVLELKVAKEDLGKIIGKQGRTARSLRTILGAASAKERKRVVLEIVE